MAALPIVTNALEDSQRILELQVDHGPAPLPVANWTKSFWINAPGANPLAAEGSEGPLTQDADVCILGSGLTGVSAAYHLGKELEGQEDVEKLKVVILDARDFCKIVVPTPQRSALNASVGAGATGGVLALYLEGVISIIG